MKRHDWLLVVFSQDGIIYEQFILRCGAIWNKIYY